MGQQVKYLGLTLNSKLICNRHVEKIASKAKSSLIVCRNIARKTWSCPISTAKDVNHDSETYDHLRCSSVTGPNRTCHNKENIREVGETCMSLHNRSNEIDSNSITNGYFGPHTLHIMVNRTACRAHLRYFISFVIQYQFHRALCEKAGEYEPNNLEKQLHECDIYKNTVAGNILKEMLAMGSSRPWPDALEVITGQRTMDATGILDYFQPLQNWLEQENRKNNAFIGWEPSKKVCTRTRKELEEVEVPQLVTSTEAGGSHV